MKITIAGAGYVGLPLAVLLARAHEVVVLDVDAGKVTQLNRGVSPLQEETGLAEQLRGGGLNLRATLDPALAYADADLVFVAAPTDYDPQTHQFDTSAVETVLGDAMRLCPQALAVIKSTVPVGFTARMRAKYATDRLIFSPEFLREGHALHDTRHPSRIVVGERSARAQQVADLLQSITVRQDAPVLYTDSAEAEAIKLFANTYLAMRVAFFNELDSYAVTRGLDTRQIIEGVCTDARIGTHYNNPSFGYGGYCLPKDTRQLLANYSEVPQNLIRAIVESNQTRLDFVAAEIARRRPGAVGIHRLAMKAGARSIRHSSVLGVMQRLQAQGMALLVYEPGLAAAEIEGAPVLRDLADFKRRSDLIVANRMTAELSDVADKVYTRDVFGRD